MKFIILGCGSSMGVPRPDGFFGNCDPKNKKNYRTRCSALIKTKEENILIDTSPDLRQQLLRHKIKKIDKVFYSHMHADQTHGINDLRSFFINSRKQIDIFADNATSKYLTDSFSYCFKSYSNEYPATLRLNKINNKMYVKNYNKKIYIKPISVDHGNVKSTCYIIDKKLAYISDISDISNKNLKYFKNLKYLIIDCLWYNFHPSHFNLDKSLFFIKKFKPKKAILTNLSPILDYDELKKKLPKNVVPAHDGLTINL
ncbi:MBL fold metallo-hydrolase [Candidatus Pelagibacter sp.]|nr:MBL fold metallo-hydrolase [Candidatus Pelagibacter sp.]MDC0925463.1 MBL fold metallo-hydrolase [Candidatus Pelagibacter sp.]MDC3288436.1 MBL fold metallo-hydrolase [Candidatus Pelagibacter sp.]